MNHASTSSDHALHNLFVILAGNVEEGMSLFHRINVREVIMEEARKHGGVGLNSMSLRIARYCKQETK